MRFSEFVDVFVAALYNETQLTGRTSFKIGDILDAYGISLNPTWRETIFKDSTFTAYVDVTRRHLGPTEDQHISLSPEGLRWVEDELGENVATFLEQHGAFHESQRLPGSVQLRDEFQAELVPASDRMVPINHNQPQYGEIRAGIDELYEEFRSANDLPIQTEERDRILSSLLAARALWESTQLKIIQIKVGIIITIEDAVDILKKVGKATGQALLVGAIKAFIKHTTGIDL